MWLNALRQRLLGQPRKRSRPRKAAAEARLGVEALENRIVPAVFNAATVGGGSSRTSAWPTPIASANTINLTGARALPLTSVNNSTDGPNGLPVIGSTVASTLTINGNGNTIQRDQPRRPFRFFDIASPRRSPGLEKRRPRER